MFRKARTLLSVWYAFCLEFRGELALWAVVMALPLIVMGLWTQAASAPGSDGLWSLSPTGFVRYFIAVFVVRQLTVAWVIHEFGYLVNTGRLSPLLLQPLDVGWRFFAAHYSEKAARLPMALILVVLVVALFPQAIHGDDGFWWPRWRNLAWALVFTELGFTVRYLMQYTMCVLAFWVERIEALDFVLYLPYLFLSGMLAPLDEFPEAARTLAMWTPFPYALYVPSMLLVDGSRFSDLQLLGYLGLVLGWIAGLWVLNRIAWRAGLKRYSAMGA
jgi:ABC-2 type transport system permease protein